MGVNELPKHTISSGDRSSWLAAVFERAVEIIVVVDPAGVVVDANQAALNYLRATRERVVGQDLAKLLWPGGDSDQSRRFAEALRQALGEGKLVRYALAHDAAAPADSALDISFTPLADPAMVIIEARVSAGTEELAEANRLLRQEIGHRRRAEEANAKFAAIVENSTDAIVGHKLDGTIVTWNAGAERIFGYTAEEMRGRSIAMLLPPGREDETPRISGAIKRGEVIQHFETERVRKDGSIIQISLTVSPIKDLAGRVVGASRISRDITHRKRMEEALRASEAKARAILDTAVDGIITIDERGSMETINRAAEELFGYAADEVIGKNVKMLMPEPYHGEHDQYMRNYLQTGKAKIIGIGREVIGKRKDGSVFPLDLAVSEVWLGERRLFTGIVRDLSERKRLEQEILDVSDREKRRIGQDLHDSLGQLLTGTGFLSKSLETRLAAKKSPETADAKQIAELVTEAIAQARGLARGLQPVEAKPTGLTTALEELARNTENLFRVKCSFRCPQPMLVEDPATATHVYRIAQEAVNNAIKHGKGKRLEVALERGADAGVFVLSVRDDGIGIPENPAAPTNRGLGLQIMTYRAAMIGGTLSIRRGATGGTLVTCSFDTAKRSATTTHAAGNP